MKFHVAVGASALVSVTAWAGINFEVGNGDRITGTIAVAGETEVFRFVLPRDAVVNVKAKAAKSGPELMVRLLDPDGDELRSFGGRTATISGVGATISGVFTLEVSAKDGAGVGGYSLSVAWKSPSKFAATATLDAAATADLPFAAERGATARLSVKPAKKSPATADLVELVTPDLSSVPFGGTAAGFTLPACGDYTLTYRNAGAAAGDVSVSVTVKPPKSTRRRVALTASVVGGGDGADDFAFASLVGGSGGTVALPAIDPGEPGSAIAGSSVSIPAGSLGSATAIVIGTATDLAVTAPSSGAGPTVFFGPEGLHFDKLDPSKRATITIPYDAGFSGPTTSLQVYTRDAQGVVSLVPPPYTVDSVNHTISVATSHFSSFRASGPSRSIGTGPAMNTLAGPLAAFDFCVAHEPSAQPPQFAFFAAGGDSLSVLALAPKTTGGPLFDVVTYAGGGGSSLDGTPRLSYHFKDKVTSVFAMQDGQVYVSTPTQIFVIDTSGNVTLFAGTFSPGDSGDEGPALSASFSGISSILVDLFGRVYVCDKIAHRIRTIDPPSYRVHAFAGSGIAGFATDGMALATTPFLGPSRIAFSQSGGLYVADGARLRRLNPSDGTNVTVAGSATGEVGSTGDDGSPTAALFLKIEGVSSFFDFEQQRELIAVSDAIDHTLRLIDRTNDTVTLLAGQHGQAGDATDANSPTTGLLDTPTAVLLQPNGAVFLDFGNSKMRRVDR